MEKHVVYKTEGVCARGIEFDIVDGIVHNVVFIGGCKGNTQGVARLAEGMPASVLVDSFAIIQNPPKNPFNSSWYPSLESSGNISTLIPFSKELIASSIVFLNLVSGKIGIICIPL